MTSKKTKSPIPLFPEKEKRLKKVKDLDDESFQRLVARRAINVAH